MDLDGQWSGLLWISGFWNLYVDVLCFYYFVHSHSELDSKHNFNILRHLHRCKCRSNHANEGMGPRHLRIHRCCYPDRFLSRLCYPSFCWLYAFATKEQTWQDATSLHRNGCQHHQWSNHNLRLWRLPLRWLLDSLLEVCSSYLCHHRYFILHGNVILRSYVSLFRTWIVWKDWEET